MYLHIMYNIIMYFGVLLLICVGMNVLGIRNIQINLLFIYY